MALWIGRAIGRAEQFGANAVSWACDPSGDVAAAILLIHAAIRHASSVVQHVLPALREQAPQQADELLRRVSENFQVQPLAFSILMVLSQSVSFLWDKQGSAADRGLQQQLLSPHTLPYLVLTLMGLTASTRRVLAAGSHINSSSSGSRTRRLTRQQQGAAVANSSSSSSRAASVPGLTGCERQLLQQLGFAPEAVAWMQPTDVAEAAENMSLALNVCTGYCHALHDMFYRRTSAGVRQLVEQHQRWTAEHKLWLLLPTVLVPCAYDLLSPSALVQWPQQGEQGAVGRAEQLLSVSKAARHASAILCQGLGIDEVRPDGWAQEMLGGLVQLAGWLGEQPLAPGPAAAAIGPTSSSSSSRSGSQVAVRAVCAGHVLALLPSVCHESPAQHETYELDSSEHGDRSDGASGVETALVPPAAARFVEYAAALETALRTATAGLQSGAAPLDQVNVRVMGICSALLLTYRNVTKSMLVQHMGLCGPAALAQEQRQLYSLLSTVLKLGRCRTAAAQLCWGEQAASSCCLAAAQAAVSLLALGAPLRPGQSAPAAMSAAAAQQPAEDYLPSLVIFGRCCLQWAEQLQQQAEGLILLAAALLQEEREYQDALLYEHSVAHVCIPGMRQGAVTMRGDWLESLVGMMSGWVGGLESAACVEQLAAAGCSPQQLQQQLDTLLAAQPGSLQEPTDASLAVLVQQLQVTGRMLCSIAVPHFCNNLACGNISGPTEVRLVSGRSCLCAGCLTARYCGRDCQRAAWKQHKPVCKALAAAAAAAAVVG
jgi:hypothetical protein